jgi:hypothetical protein
MPRVRGRTKGVYTTDGATDYKTSVDSDRFADANFNWSAAGAALNPLPRGAKPRHVTGLSPTSGRRGAATVPNITAAIWTGAATTFEVEADDGTIDTMTVTSKFGERPVMA